MQKTSFFPPFIRTLSVLFIGTLLALVLARGAMLGILWPEVAGNPASDILNALYIGTKFDIRMVVLGLIPIALILGIPPLERLLVRSRGFRGLIDLLYATVFAAATLVYNIDFGWFFYMHTRVDASLFELLGDPDIAGTMVWESYPVVWITFGLIVV
ncbi:MAG: sulfatase, partial [Bilophila wadsworthia]